MLYREDAAIELNVITNLCHILVPFHRIIVAIDATVCERYKAVEQLGVRGALVNSHSCSNGTISINLHYYFNLLHFLIDFNVMA